MGQGYCKEEKEKVYIAFHKPVELLVQQGWSYWDNIIDYYQYIQAESFQILDD